MRTLAARAGRLVTTVAMLAAFVTVASLAAIQLGHQQLFTVISGSMTPTFVAGDTVLVKNVDADELKPGMIVTFHAPGDPDHLTTHRVLSLRPMPTGLFVQTKGDANEDPDPNFTHSADVVGQVGTIVPVVGRWLMFYQSPVGRIVVLGTPLLLLAFGQAIQTWEDLRRAQQVRRARAATATRGSRRSGASVAVTLGLAVGLTVVAGAGGVVLGKSTGAVYAATATSSNNTFSTGLFCGSNDYATSVLADNPVQYHKLNEASGTTAADSSGNNDPASYVGTKTLGVTGAVCGDTTAVKLNGTNAYIDNANVLATINSTFAFEAWVKTSASGVVAAANAQTGVDRQLYIGANGRAYLASANSSGSTVYVSSPATVADGAWHHLVATSTGSAMTMYVDGVAVGTTSTNQGTGRRSRMSYGYASLPSGLTSAPGTDYLNGSLDEVAVYTGTLSASRVLAHYKAGNGQ